MSQRRLSAVTPEHARTALLTLRLAIAAGSLAAPKATGKLFGIDADANPAAPYLARLFGVRDGWLAVEVMATDGAEQQRLLRRGAWVDATDVASAVIAGAGKQLPARAAVLVGATAATAVFLGLRAAGEV
jgi:hypothetical protein